MLMKIHVAFHLICIVALSLMDSHMSDAAELPVSNPAAPNAAIASAGRTLTLAERTATDQQALSLTPEQLTPSKLEFYGDLTGWLVSRAPLPKDEEAARVLDAHRKRMETSKQVQPFGLELIVLMELSDALPIHMKPVVDEFLIDVVETDEFISDTVGSPYIHLSKSFVERCVADPKSGKQRLAFAIAHELGHIILGHCRRRHQMMWFQQLIDKGVDIKLSSKKIEEMLRQTVAKSQHSVRFLASLDEDFQADLFAIHLMRNAGHDVELGLDVVRHFAISPVDSDAGSDSGQVGAANLRALQRLQRLRMDIDGRVYHHKTEYGLFEFDRSTGERTIVADNALLGVDRAVVCVHGMESDLTRFAPLVKQFSKTLPDDVRLFGLQYPGDASLSCIGRFMTNEMERTSASTENFDFVCHSAGGLIVRYFAEVDQKMVGRVVMIATPHFGSDLSQLRPLLEAKQFFGNLKLGYDDAVEKAITDGKGQISLDLQPYSLFLSFLNKPAHARSPARYYIVNGRAFSPLKGLLLQTSVVAARKTLQRVLFDQAGAGSLRRGIHEWIDRIHMPAEITRGDLAVSLDSSSLEDVADETTFDATHSDLPSDPEVVRHIMTIMNQPPLDELDLLLP